MRTGIRPWTLSWRRPIVPCTGRSSSLGNVPQPRARSLRESAASVLHPLFVVMGNLLLRVGLALSIVLAAVGLTFAAPNSFVTSEASTATPAASAAPVVAGYQAAPLSNSAAAPSASTQQGQQA